MGVRLFANNAISTLASGINNSVTTLDVASGHGARFPNPSGGDFFMATITEGSTVEIVKVTARSTDSFTTIARAQEGTSAASFTTAATVKLMPTAAMMTELKAAQAGGMVTLGYDTVGGSDETMTRYRVYMKKITLALPGIVHSIGAYIKGTTGDNVQNLSAALHGDSAGSPLRLIAQSYTPQQVLVPQSVTAALAGRWLHLPIGLYVPAGDYWLAVQNNSTPIGTIAYDGSGSDRHYSPGNSWMSDGGFYSVTTGSLKYSIRAHVQYIGVAP